jgi:adenylate cyclase
MFADVSGSTQMYERLGDTEAHDCISESLQRIIEHADRNNGTLIETIGDEAMLTFESSIDAASAAVDMQQHFFRSPVAKKHFVKIRIGFHYGPIEYDDGHPFGDTVNVAARVASLCESERIIATASSLSNLGDPAFFQLRPYQTAMVKGKSKPIRVQEIVWDRDDATSVFNMTHATQIHCHGLRFSLHYQGKTIEVSQEMPAFVIGRGEQCDLVIDSALASRAHAKIEFRWGEVILTDHSTNGTFIQAQHGKRESDGSAIRLHRREAVLQGKGRISIGSSIEKADAICLLGFEINVP